MPARDRRTGREYHEDAPGDPIAPYEMRATQHAIQQIRQASPRGYLWFKWALRVLLIAIAVSYVASFLLD